MDRPTGRQTDLLGARVSARLLDARPAQLHQLGNDGVFLALGLGLTDGTDQLQRMRRRAAGLRVVRGEGSWW